MHSLWIEIQQCYDFKHAMNTFNINPFKYAVCGTNISVLCLTFERGPNRLATSHHGVMAALFPSVKVTRKSLLTART
jgi:hypothetical protein